MNFRHGIACVNPQEKVTAGRPPGMKRPTMIR
jgi:hypothetical protein